jgi:hypothetical protein
LPLAVTPAIDSSRRAVLQTGQTGPLLLLRLMTQDRHERMLKHGVGLVVRVSAAVGMVGMRTRVPWLPPWIAARAQKPLGVLSVARAVMQRLALGAQVEMQPAVPVQQPSVTDRRTLTILRKGGKVFPVFFQLAAMAVMRPQMQLHLTREIKP